MISSASCAYLVGVGAVLGQGRPGRVGEGQVHHPAAPLRPGGEQLAVRGEAAHDVLGQLGPVHPDDQLAVARGLAERADVRPDVPGPGALPQRGRVHAERVHGHLGDVAPVGHPPDRARAGAVQPGAGHVRAEQGGAAVHERAWPTARRESRPGPRRGCRRAAPGPPRPGASGSSQAAPRACGRSARCRRRRAAAAQPVPQQPRGQAQVVVLDQHPQAAVAGGASRSGPPAVRASANASL